MKLTEREHEIMSEIFDRYHQDRLVKIDPAQAAYDIGRLMGIIWRLTERLDK